MMRTENFSNRVKVSTYVVVPRIYYRLDLSRLVHFQFITHFKVKLQSLNSKTKVVAFFSNLNIVVSMLLSSNKTFNGLLCRKAT